MVKLPAKSTQNRGLKNIPVPCSRTLKYVTVTEQTEPAVQTEASSAEAQTGNGNASGVIIGVIAAVIAAIAAFVILKRKKK